MFFRKPYFSQYESGLRQRQQPAAPAALRREFAGALRDYRRMARCPAMQPQCNVLLSEAGAQIMLIKYTSPLVVSRLAGVLFALCWI